MKRTKFIPAVISLAAAASMLTVPAAAKLEVVESEYVGYDQSNIPETWIETSSQSWTVDITIARNAFINDAEKIEFIVSLNGAPEQYEADKASGFTSDGETAFVEFSGSIGISSEDWKAYEFTSLEDTDGDTSANAAVKALGDNRYSFSADLSENKAVAPDREVKISFNDWSAATDDYWLTVDELLVWDASGNVLAHFDGDGAPDFDYTIPETAEETEETPATETTAAETAPAETTSASAEETTAAATTESVNKDSDSGSSSGSTANTGTVQSGNADFGSRDSSLLIVGIVAGVVIVAVIVALIMIMLKKKK